METELGIDVDYPGVGNEVPWFPRPGAEWTEADQRGSPGEIMHVIKCGCLDGSCNNPCPATPIRPLMPRAKFKCINIKRSSHSGINAFENI